MKAEESLLTKAKFRATGSGVTVEEWTEVGSEVGSSFVFKDS